MKLLYLSKIILILYFVNLFLYSISSLVGLEELENIFWFIRIPILLVLYLVSSKKRQFLYIMALLLYQSASVCFKLEIPNAFIYATLSSVLFKFCFLFLILDLITKENRFAIGIAFIPFFILYLYIIEIVVNALGNVYYIWIINALVTSFIGGVGIICYVNNADKKSYWLLISGILFIIQIGAFFINKFYIKNEAIYQMVILSYAISHFTFYKFIILKEQEKQLN
ncbi:hypothetical protein [Flavobacterium sp.]|uniref:hypothetical protein n=1 Tax=Flavobacterium sp. TaxID=239 RepID=UPI00261461B6|nr:hypothetical protein [Flavobacterium sp.]